MSTTLSYDIKRYMRLLTHDNRWNVLTVLILHANIRNRCFVGMDTIAEMATNGNKTKAARAKRWLQDHGAFELVPKDKRVKEETRLPSRQHVYQLTGELVPCDDDDCECHQWLNEHSNSYLHYANHVPNGQNIDEPHVLNGENNNVLDGQNLHVLASQNGSMSLISKKEKESTPLPYHIANGLGMTATQKQNVDLQAVKGSPIWQAFKSGWDGLEPEIPLTMAGTARAAIDVLREDIEKGKYTLADIEGLTRQKLKNPKTAGYRITFIKTDIAEYLAAKRAAQSSSGIVIDPNDQPDDEDSATKWMRKVEAS